MIKYFRTSILGAGVLLLGANAQAQTTNTAAKDDPNAVVVTAPRQAVLARKMQFEAPNLVNVQAAETIIKYPDFNAAEALGRIPGVSISTDTGEGRFVNIRGIDGNLAGATFGGVPLLNTYPGGTYFGGGGRAVEYDTIPTGSIDGIVVTKTPLPDHEAESLGGSVELTPRTAANVNQPFLDATAGWGYEPMHDHAGPLNLDLALGGRFGLDGGHLVMPDQADSVTRMGFFSNPTPFSLVLTANWRSDRRGFDDIEEDYNDPTTDRSYQDLQLRHYDYHRRRFGYGGEFDFQPNEDHAWYLRANIAGYTESVAKNRLTYDFSGYTPPAINPSDPNGFSTQADIQLASTDEQETHRNQVYVIGGKDDFSGVILDYRASYSRATYTQSKNYGAKFNGPQGIPVNYDNSANNGDFPAIMADFAEINDPSQYNPTKKISNSTEFDKDEEYAYAADLLVPTHVFSDQDFLKFGGEARLRDKSSMPDSFTSAITPLSLADASGPAITNFYYNYTNGPFINAAAVRSAYAGGAISGGLDLSSVFTAREDIYAGYGEYQAVFGKLSVTAGVRVEATNALYGAYSDDNAAQTLAFVQQPDNYTNVFPSFQVRYEIQPNMLFRAIYSTGIGRPGFLQNTASTSSNHDPTDPQITQGNPNLKPTTGQNFDLSWEYYLPKGGVLQLGAFYKLFDNYIVTEYERRLYTGTDPEFAGLITGYTTFANRPDAFARGLEAAYHQQFIGLPGWWSGFGVDANVTLVDSRILEYDAATSGSGQNEYGLLPGTSRLTWNAAAFYEKYGVQLRLAAEYVSKELFSLGGDKTADTIQDSRLTLDFTSSYEVTKNWAVYFNVKNLLNTPLRFYVYQPSFPIQREFYEQTFEAGIRAKF